MSATVPAFLRMSRNNTLYIQTWVNFGCVNSKKMMKILENYISFIKCKIGHSFNIFFLYAFEWDQTKSV
jgi:hypothetical protein